MKQIRTPNYNTKKFTDRKSSAVKTSQEWDVIVNHIMEGYAPSTINYIDRPSVQVSAHFIIGRNGEIWRQVDLKHGAWHCIRRKPSAKIVKSRTVPPNLYTIGIEHEGMHRDTNGRLTEKQYEATLFAHKYTIERYERTFKKPFKIDRDHIIGHYEVDTVNRSKTDPGIEFPFDRLIKDLQEWDRKRKEPPNAITATATVNVRTGPNNTSTRIGTVQKGEQVEMTGRSGGWIEVLYKGKKGYTYSNYWNVPKTVADKFKPEPNPPVIPPKETDKPDPYNGPHENEDGVLWFRTVGGSFRTRKEAEDELVKMRNKGFKGAWLQAVRIKK